MNIKDLTPGDSEATRLTQVDSLVAQGLSRKRSEKLVKKLYDFLEGPWLDLLNHKDIKTRGAMTSEIFAEQTLLRTFFVAYLTQWADERMTIGAVQQALAFHFLSEQDAQSKEAR